MTTLTHQKTRIQLLLQENDTSANRAQQIFVAHQEEMVNLARQERFGNVTWLQGIANQALYTLPTTTVSVAYVFYNEQCLRYTSERMLDRKLPGWERPSNEPEYWTYENENPNVVRLVPQPVRTGSDVLNSLFAPLPQYTADNLVIFLFEDVSPPITDETDTLPVLNFFDDWLVFQTTAKLAAREVETQNLPVAQACQQLANLWLRLL